jgi:octaprenyl-diphosphate synthase
MFLKQAKVAESFRTLTEVADSPPPSGPVLAGATPFPLGSVQARIADAATVVFESTRVVELALATCAAAGPAPGPDVANHLLAAGGKRIRPLLALLSAQAVLGSREPHAVQTEAVQTEAVQTKAVQTEAVQTKAVETAAVVAEMVHVSTLLHDDVLDDGSERRGVPTARRIWGNALSVLGGDLLLTAALELASEGTSPRVFSELLRTLRALVEGEIVQLRGRTKLDLSEAVYAEVIENKTASLFGWAARAGAFLGGGSEAEAEALGQFGMHLGRAFQMVDDVIDYSSNTAATGKGLYADLCEGKPTLPLVLALRVDAGILPLVSAVRAGESQHVAEIAARVRATGVLDEVRARAEQCTASFLADLADSRARAVLIAVAKDLAGRVG